MLHILVIVMLAAIATHDALASGGGAFAHYYDGATGWWTPFIVAGPMLVLAALAWLVCINAGAMLDRGRHEALNTADRTASATRIGTVCLHIANVLIFGWIDFIRGLIGDVIVLDELLALVPALLVFCASWAAQWPLERRMREAVGKRQLDQGLPTYAIPTRGQFVFGHLRHQVLLSLVPILMLLGWAECAERAADWLSTRRSAATGLLAWLGSIARDPSSRSSSLLAVQFVGVAVVLSLAPLALRYVWDTVQLSPGPLRDRLEGMCRRHRIGVRELLVWRTHGAMINGAVMGLWSRLRYILLTDALLDSLRREQVEAVMAHELGHIRHRHMPWLIAVMIISLMFFSLLGTLILWLWTIATYPDALNASPLQVAVIALGGLGLEVLIGILLLVGVFAVFAFVSRRFEWQADAFAVLHLSAEHEQANPDTAPAGAINAAGVAAMTSALAAVSHLNHISLDRGSMRHGSLRLRITKLNRLIGTPVDHLPIDRTVRRIKLFTLAAAAFVAALMTAAMWLGI